MKREMRKELFFPSFFYFAHVAVISQILPAAIPWGISAHYFLKDGFKLCHGVDFITFQHLMLEIPYLKAGTNKLS